MQSFSDSVSISSIDKINHPVSKDSFNSYSAIFSATSIGNLPLNRLKFDSSKNNLQATLNNFNVYDNWVSGNLNPNELKNNLKRTTIYLPEDLHRNLKIKAANQKTTMTDLIIEAIEKDLKQH